MIFKYSLMSTKHDQNLYENILLLKANYETIVNDC